MLHPMNKQHILDEIRRTAKANNGAPLGKRMFLTETGIKESDWLGRYWARWGDAVREAGLVPNTRRPKTDEDVLLKQLGGLIRELGRYPTVGEMRLRKRQNDAFPNHKVLERTGSRPQWIERLWAFCQRTEGWSDVAAICRIMAAAAPETRESESGEDFETGYVYLALMKVGREKRYKIGKADIVGRRTQQIAVQLPEDLDLIHAISTDDAYGIEAYWHKRFAAKRRGGEWFELTGADVKAFRRRKFM
jgi:Meiotically up-regulated gene 113